MSFVICHLSFAFVINFVLPHYQLPITNYPLILRNAKFLNKKFSILRSFQVPKLYGSHS
ncbi:hypothetical protein FDUTEX481_05464 [Tolypothrix sp. PCC 7601]|nr:hypothetical protein FDUTEX481_05464 [Tolypothrix sp. PCC 7601]